MNGKSALFSKCGKYRYRLHRVWDEKLPHANILMFNPSTADAETDDPTIKSLTRIMTANDFGSFTVYNIYAFISPYPAGLKKMTEQDKLGDNLKILREIKHEPVIIAYGKLGNSVENKNFVEGYFDQIYSFGSNKDGSPKHPLYLKTETKIITHWW